MTLMLTSDDYVDEDHMILATGYCQLDSASNGAARYIYLIAYQYINKTWFPAHYLDDYVDEDLGHCCILPTG